MTTLREAAQQALEALTPFVRGNWTPGLAVQAAAAMERLEAALAEPVEPVKQCMAHGECFGGECIYQRPAEPVQEAVAIVGTQEDTWKGYGGQWAPPGPPIKTVHMLRELPEGTLLYAAPPQRPVEPVQEPVAWFHTDFGSLELSRVQRVGWKPLYAAPPQRLPLTEEEIKECERQAMVNGSLPFEQRVFFARAIERTHGIK